MSTTATAEPKLEEIVESVGAESITEKIDREAGVIRDVLILSADSRNGRRYSAAARKDVVRLYEGQQVHTNHDLKAKGNRSEETAFGELKNVREVELAEEVRGDLHYLKSHPATERILERAERNFKGGLSHHAFGEVTRKGGSVLVESVSRCSSVDYVMNPATTVTLFESQQPKLAEVAELAEAEQPALAPILATLGDNDSLRELVESTLASSEATDPLARLGVAVSATIAGLCDGEHADGGVALVESLRELVGVNSAEERAEELSEELIQLRRDKMVGEALAEFGLTNVPRLRRAELLECETVEAMHARIAKWPLTKAKTTKRQSVESVLTEGLDDKSNHTPKAEGTPLHQRHPATATKE